MIAAWALAVVSSEGQAETLPHQEAWAKKTCSEKGWKLTRVFTGVATGKDGPRKTVTELLVALRETPDRPEWLLMLRTDRLGRGTISDQLPVRAELRKLGVRIWTRDAGERLLNSDEDELVAALDAYVARKENSARRDKATGVYRRKLAAGTWTGNKRPYGLTWGPSGDVVVEREAEIIRQMFALRLEGLGYYTIGKKLAPIAPPVRLADGTEKYVRWGARRIHELLKNRAFVGKIVDEVTFHRAQAVAESISSPGQRAPKSKAYPMPLTGCVKCHCGYRMSRKITGRRSKWPSYGCAATWNHDGHMIFISARKLDRQFVALLERLAASPELIGEMQAAAHRGTSPVLLDTAIRRATARIAEIESARDKVWDAHAAGKLRDDDLQPRLDALRSQRDEAIAERDELLRERGAIEATTVRMRDAAALISRAAEIYKTANSEDQAKIAAAVTVTLGGLYLDSERVLRCGPVTRRGSILRRHHQVAT